MSTASGVQRDAERGAVAGFLSPRNRYRHCIRHPLPLPNPLSLPHLSVSHRCTVAAIAGRALAHRDGSGNKLEGARECLSGIRGGDKGPAAASGGEIASSERFTSEDKFYTDVCKRCPLCVQFLRTINPSLWGRGSAFALRGSSARSNLE